MRLKVLIVPFFIVMILVLAIGYIKPDYDTIQLKRATIASKELEVANIELVKSNISSLNSSLDTQPEAEKFLYDYLPQTMNQEQVLDAFNFLANQAGLVITAMEMEIPVEVAPPEPILAQAPSIFAPGGSAPTEVVPAAPVVAKTFILTGNVAGQYENIKTFFNQVSRIERFQKMRLFSIETDKTTTAASDEEQSVGNLIGTFEAEFGYLPAKSLPSALGVPIFLQTKFDVSSIDTLLTELTSPIPTLEKGETGKPNPFQ